MRIGKNKGDGRKQCDVEEFLEKLLREDNFDLRTLQSRLENIALTGLPTEERKCKYLKDKMYEIRAGGLRLFCFREGRQVIIATHGMKKGTKKEQNREIKKAKRRRVEYMSQKK